ncbi:MAG: TolC family protein [Bryobacterales bacterium]|nr:TolC family protein [Bryobacterales bacterium]MBV9400787.1 TolC family protein [Bryobacterales bacterium]
MRVLLLLIPAALAYGQPTMQLSLKHAVEIALTPEGSTRVALAEESVKQAATHVTQARAAFLPTIDGNVTERNETVNLQTFGINFSLPLFGFSVPALAGPFVVFDARASAEQSVFNYSDIRKYQASRLALAATNSDLETTKNQVSDQVARGYAVCLRAEADLETARANVELSNALERLAVSQKNAGTGTGIEVTRAQVQLANDRQRLIVAENDRQRAVRELLRTMGLNLDIAVEFTDRLSYAPVNVADLEASLKTAREDRAELKAQQQREATAKMNYNAVTAERYPTVGVFGDYGATGLQIDSARPTRQYGVSVKVPVFDGFRRESRRAESYSQYKQETIRTRDLLQQVELEVRLALDSLRSAQAQVETARDGLSLAQNELAQAQRRYQAGVTNSIEVTDAQTRLIRAQDNQIAALYAYDVARIDLATATGGIREYVNQ